MPHKNLSTSTVYLSEVLGIKNYLCPKSIHSLRSIRGGIPCRVLALVFKSLSPTQHSLLKKIMASIDVFEFSILEIKDQSILSQCLSSEVPLANFIIFFGGEALVQKGVLVEREGLFYLADPKLSSGNFAENKSPLKKLNSSSSKDTVSQKEISFLSVVSLEELEGDSPESRSKKQKLWQQLKQWKKLSNI